MQVTPWTWTDSDGQPSVRREVDEKGWSYFHAPDALEWMRDPVGLARRLFGRRPVRMQAFDIAPAPGPARTYPKTMTPARLHTDCAFLGIPPHVQVMVCVRPARTGGESLLLDLWPVVRRIEAEEPALFDALFDTVRHLRFGHLSHYGATLSARRGNLLLIHPPFPLEGDPVATGFQRHVDAAEPVRFTAAAGDVYVNNNHRCVHGRGGFADPDRHFRRFLFWFAEPWSAPPDLLHRAEAAAERTAGRLADQPRWVREALGVDVPRASPVAHRRLAEAIRVLVECADTESLPGAGASEVMRWCEVLLAAALPALEEDLPAEGPRHAHLLGLLERLRAVTSA